MTDDKLRKKNQQDSSRQDPRTGGTKGGRAFGNQVGSQGESNTGNRGENMGSQYEGRSDTEEFGE